MKYKEKKTNVIWTKKEINDFFIPYENDNGDIITDSKEIIDNINSDCNNYEFIKI